MTETRPPPGPVPIQRYGKYYLISKLAEGGMAEIFLAKQVGVEGFEKNVVVKRMLAHLSTVPDFVSMFLDEARLASRLGHPNVVQVLDLGFEAGCYFITMEYLAGEDFSTIIRSAAKQRAYVPLNIALKILVDAAQGLHYAHDFTDSKGQPLNVVHRDVSPSNIFVTYSGQVKVLDFGIAKAESRVTNTTAGVVKGKYQYMSPEQAQSMPVDRRADVYSLGVCMYEALCNARPFARDTDLAILNAVLKNEYRPPKQLRPDLPVELEQILVKALARDPEERFPSAGAFATALEQYLRASTSVTSGTAVTQYMTTFFGPERVAQKTRIDSLEDMQARGIRLPPMEVKAPSNPSGPSVVVPAVPTNVSPMTAETGTAAIGTPRSVVEMRKRGSYRTLIVGGVALVLGIGGTIAVLKGREDPKLPLVVPPPLVIDAGAPVIAPPPVVDAGDPPDELDAGAPMTTPDAGRKPQPPRPVVLSSDMITSIVRRNSGRLVECFREHRAELAGPTGTVPVTLVIEKTGKVRSVSVPSLKGTAVAQCLEGALVGLRFPAHVDDPLSITLPLSYK